MDARAIRKFFVNNIGLFDVKGLQSSDLEETLDDGKMSDGERSKDGRTTDGVICLCEITLLQGQFHCC